MWKIYEDPTEYLFQTDDANIARKMRNRKGFVLFSRGVNCKLWVFIAKFKRCQHAIGALKTLSGDKVVFNVATDVFEAETTVC